MFIDLSTVFMLFCWHSYEVWTYCFYNGIFDFATRVLLYPRLSDYHRSSLFSFLTTQAHKSVTKYTIYIKHNLVKNSYH